MSEKFEKQFVQDLKEKDQIRSVFLAEDKLLLRDRNGKPYITLNLRDSTGCINARIWEKAEEIENAFNSGDFVIVKGHVQVYQNRRQIVVHDLCVADGCEYDIADFVSANRNNPNELLDKLYDFVETVEDEHIQSLLRETLQDEKIKEALLKAPAAKSIHHAYMGGLLEHVVSICKVMDLIAGHYKLLNRDYLIFGAIYHDIGKISELKIENGIQYSDQGRLVGHMGIACEMIDQKASQILGFPESKKDLLKHIVLSHHGRLEYGSPKTPVFPEAVVTALIDDLDSKLDTLFSFMENELEGGESWTRFHQGFDRYFYLEIFKERKKRLGL